MKKLPGKPQRTFKFPWDRDPHDLEANYRRPVPKREWIRLYLKIVLAVAAGLWFRSASQDRTDEGAELAIAFGFVLTEVAIVDLLYLRTHDLEQIFLGSKQQQVAVRSVVLAVGLAVLIAGLFARFS